MMFISAFNTLRCPSGNRKLNMSQLVELTVLTMSIQGEEAVSFLQHSLESLPRRSLCTINITLACAFAQPITFYHDGISALDDILLECINVEAFDCMIIGCNLIYKGIQMERMARKSIDRLWVKVKQAVGTKLITVHD